MREQSIEFQTGDGRICNLIHVLGHQKPTRGPVTLVHGAGVRSNIFLPPNSTNFANIDLPRCEWTPPRADCRARQRELIPYRE